VAYNVLIVDDSPAMRRFVRRVLELTGIELGRCLEANNGLEALDLLRLELVDIVLTDINMPLMDGEELLRALKADSALQAIPVLVLSTDRSASRVKQMLDLGAGGYVGKPFLPGDLGGEMTKLLAGGAYESN
jgi:two-component system, chemotaxis family, chemotaxis protein CheY